MIEFIFWVTILSFLIQIIYWIFLTYYLTSNKRYSDANIAISNKVSIIICARNEAVNLTDNLPFFLSQKNIVFELIVVNDHSDDETLNILKKFSADHSELIIVDLANEKQPGKKNALRKGIEHARFENILLSDADCRPSSPFWAAKMLAGIDPDHQLVAGYAPFTSGKTFVARFSTFENIITALQYIGFGIAGMPYMGVGRNMGYSASLIKKLNYFDDHKDLMAGDDDLTVQAALAETKIKFILDKDTFVMSQSAKTWAQYFKQKARHYSVSKRYATVFIFLLGLFGLTWAMFYSGLLVIAFCMNIWWVIILLFIRYILIIICFKYIQKVLHQHLRITDILLFDAAFPFVMGILSIFGLLKTKQHWK